MFASLLETGSEAESARSVTERVVNQGQERGVVQRQL